VAPELCANAFAAVVRVSLPILADHRCCLAFSETAEIADTLEMSVGSVAHCIGLHHYFESHRTSEVTIPPPFDYWAPAVTDVIDCEMLNPTQPARMLAVEAAMQEALAEVVIDRTLAQRRHTASALPAHADLRPW